MRNHFASKFYQLAKKNSKLTMVVADISPAGSITEFREEYPERFINTGVSEQSMIGIAAGLAMGGMRPFAYTIATFALYRPFEFIRDDIAYQNLPVTIVGVGGGVTYSTLGATHHAMEDISIASAIPGMQVFAPCDPLEVEAITEWLAIKNMKPAYLRIGKAGEPNLTENAVDKFIPKKLRKIRLGKDVCIISYGGILKLGLELADELEKKYNKKSTVVSCHCLKPLDLDGIKSLLNSHAEVIVIEEHVPHGGLSSRVKEIAWDIQARCNLKCFTLKDEFIHHYGSHESILDTHGLSIEKIMSNL